jgi:hypothetical protein
MTKVTTLALATLLGLSAASPLYADDAVNTSIADLYRDRSDLAGRQVTLKGTVVKVNNNIMRRNFVHVQDGSGDAGAGTNDVTVTTQDTVSVGDRVSVSGTVTVDQDFGYGYSYPLLVEQASVTRAD